MPINVEHVSYVYATGTASETRALSDVSLTIEDGDAIGIIGPTGSGKSTLAQHLNGLLKPTEGRVLVDGVDTRVRGPLLREIRRSVGLVFQYPEVQFFESTVYDEIAFGARNLGLDPKEVDARVKSAIERVGLPQELLNRVPFELSGGQMRRVALAGVLVMNPRVLVLDEPTAGLDPRGRQMLISQLNELNRSGITLVVITHDLEDLIMMVRKVVILDKGKIAASGSTREILTSTELLESHRLSAPEVPNLMHQLRLAGREVSTNSLTLDEAEAEILRLVGAKASV